MRYLRYAFLVALAIVLVTVALANRASVNIHLLPEGLGGFLGLSWALELPLFIVIFTSIVAGILIGFLWEWLREHKLRAEGQRAKRAATALSREVKALKGQEAKAGDEVLALLDKAG